MSFVATRGTAPSHGNTRSSRSKPGLDQLRHTQQLIHEATQLQAQRSADAYQGLQDLSCVGVLPMRPATLPAGQAPGTGADDGQRPAGGPGMVLDTQARELHIAGRRPVLALSELQCKVLAILLGRPGQGTSTAHIVAQTREDCPSVGAALSGLIRTKELNGLLRRNPDGYLLGAIAAAPADIEQP